MQHTKLNGEVFEFRNIEMIGAVNSREKCSFSDAYRMFASFEPDGNFLIILFQWN